MELWTLKGWKVKDMTTASGATMEEIIDTLRGVPLFSGLGRDQLASLSAVVRQRLYAGGAIILTEGEPGEALFSLKKGSAKVTRADAHGREVILAFVREGEFFGELSILDGLARSANVIALEESEVYIIERSDFVDLIQHHSALSLHLLREMARRIRASNQQIEYLALSGAESRVFRTVLRVAEEVGSQEDDSGAVLVELPFQHDLADMAGTSRETVSRVLRNLEARGLIARSGGKVQISSLRDLRALSSGV